MVEKKRLTISLAGSVLSKLDSLAKDKGLSKSAIITFLIENEAKE